MQKEMAKREKLSKSRSIIAAKRFEKKNDAYAYANALRTHMLTGNANGNVIGNGIEDKRGSGGVSLHDLFRAAYPDTCSAISPETDRELNRAIERDGLETILAGTSAYAEFLAANPGYQYTYQAYNFLSKSAYLRDWKAETEKQKVAVAGKNQRIVYEFEREAASKYDNM
jgi:hypothetical protein